jgi:hypothetical protein
VKASIRDALGFHGLFFAAAPALPFAHCCHGDGGIVQQVFSALGVNLLHAGALFIALLLSLELL